MMDAEARRELIQSRVMEGLRESFPVQSRNKTIEVDNLHVVKKDYSPTEQKYAILSGDTLFESIKGTLRLRDKDGKILDEIDNFTLVRVPYFTPRHTFIIGGNEHSISHMVRRKPGVYARKRANGILEAGFNTLGGSNFRVSMDPEKGQPLLEYKASKIPLYPILRQAGISHEEISKAWGPKLADANAKVLERKGSSAVDKLYAKEVPVYAQEADLTPKEKMAVILERFKASKMDPEVNRQTLGSPYDHVTPESLLTASGKVLKIFNNQAEVDEQDNLGYKTLASVDDFFKERIKLHAREVGKKAAIKVEVNPDLRRAVPSGPFTKDLLKFISSTSLAAIPDQTNPMDLVDSSMRVTSIGEGGLSSERAIPIDARQTHVTQMGALDPIRTPESMRAGIDVRAAVTAQRDDNGDIYVPIYDVRTKRNKYIKAGDLQTSIVAFPFQKMKGTVDVLEKGVVRKVPASRVDYMFPHQSQMYSPTTNLIPFLESAQGNRAVMGSKMQVQALSLLEREIPFVQVATPSGKSFESMLGRVINPSSPVAGVVQKIDDDYIYIKPDAKLGAAEQLIKIPYNKNFPLAAKTYLNHDITVKPGDHVKEKQLLGDSNFTRDGTLALGKNMRVAYMPYYGANSNDAVVVSEEASRKLTSERMYKVVVNRDPGLTLDAKKHQVYYGHNYTTEQRKNLDDGGVIKPGTKVLPGDPLVVGVRKTELSPDDLIFGKLHRSLAKPHKEFAQTWDHDNPGEVVDVVITPSRVAITVKTAERASIGDKLCYAKGTGILTAHGWKKVENITQEDRCYTLNSRGEIELHCPESVHHYENAGEMYALTTQQVDLRVTANHSLYIKKRGAATYSLVQACDAFGKRVRHKKDGIWEALTPDFFALPELENSPDKTGKGQHKAATAACRHTPIPMLNWLAFLGVYIANGSTTVHVRKDRPGSTEYWTSVHTIKGQKHSVSGDQYSMIRGILDSCGFAYTAVEDRFVIHSKQLTCYLTQFGHAPEKHLPAEVFTYGKDAAEVLLNALISCDGHKTQSGSYGYTTVSYRLAEDIQRLALHAGWSGNIKTHLQSKENWNTRYTVQFVRAKNQPQVNHGHARTQGGQEEILFVSREPVYGITVPNHTLYTCMNGKPVWSGNSGRYGNKGVISQIVPDDQMVKDEKGRPIDILLTSAGVVSRINPSQIIETAVGKVVEKTGKPIIVENFTGRDNVQWAKDLLKKHDIKDKETVYDPVSGKEIHNIMVGRQYIYKLFKSTDTNYSARSTEAYDMNQQPTRGGVQGSKAVGRMEFDALLGHNARNILRESASLKSQKNDEFWRAIQLGQTPPEPKTVFAYDKFLGMLTGAGVRVNRENSTVALSPLTDKDVLELSSGEIRDAKIVRAKDLHPETGGLFDPAVTGGLKGTRWGHIELAEPVMNPIFKEPIRRLLGLTTGQLDTLYKDKGGAYIRKELKHIDMDEKEKELLSQMKRKKADQLDNEIKQLKYLRALKRLNLRPEDAYVVSKVPVVPPVMRPITPGQGGTQIVYGDANPLYQDLIYVNNQLKDVKNPNTANVPHEEERLRPVLQQAVGAVYGTDDPITAKSKGRQLKGFLTYISGVGGPKHGFFQSKLMSKSQDFAGRGTIVPDSTLGIDEVGLPEEMLWKLYDKFVVRRLVQQGFPALQARQMVEDRHVAAKEALRREVQERPVLLNRTPTLHRYNIVGARPVMVPGKTIRINPFIEAGMNADFDGDSGSDMLLIRTMSPLSVSYFGEDAGKKQLHIQSLYTNEDCALDSIVPAGYYTLHIRDFPRKRRSKKVKRNKETYSVPEGVCVFGYDETDRTVKLRSVTSFSIHHNLSMVLVRTASGRVTEVSQDESMLGLNPSTGALEKFSPYAHPNWAIPRPRKLTCDTHTKKSRLVLSTTFASQKLKAGSPQHQVDPVLTLSSDLGWFVGALIGDGWVAYHDSARRMSTLGLANVDENVRRKFEEVGQTLVSGGVLSSKTYSNPHEWEGHKCLSKKIHLNNTALASAIAELINYCRGAHNKRIPSFFVTAPREFLLGLFAGLLDTDGTVSVVKAKAKNKPQIMSNYTTVSLGLAYDVSTLALLLGISNRVTPYKSRNAYAVSFSTPAMQQIAAEIPCIHAQKVKGLKQLAKWDFSYALNSNKDDTVPMLLRVTDYLMQRFGSGNAEKLYPNTLKGDKDRQKHKSVYVILCKAKRTSRVGRSTWEYLKKYFGEEILRNVGGDAWYENADNPNLVWDYVEEVVPLEGKHTAWDLTVPDGNTFVTASQLIVFDTMQVHVPIGAKAVEEAQNMTTSKLLFGDKSKSDLLVFPQHEAIMGINHASSADDKNTTSKRFKTKADAAEAYRQGKITMGTHMTVTEKK
jgi:DNA-directed RNA polymerase beta subunit/intein/homing endonuclease